MHHRIALAACALAVSATASSQETPTTFVTIVADNDWFAHQDRHYTSGSHVAFVKPIDALPGFARNLAAPFSWSADRTVALSIGQRLYTPGNTNPKPDEPPDRPYAAWLYAQADIRMPSGPFIDHVFGTVGYIGPAAGGRQLQKFSHHIFRSDVLGWENQLKSEPTLMIGFDRSWPAMLERRSGAFVFDLSPHAGVAAGTPYTYANAGVVARFGRNLPSDVPLPHLTLGTPVDGYRGTASFGWYAWAGIDARGVLWNTFLDGSTFRDSPSVDRKSFHHDVQFGLVLAWPRTRAGFTLVQRSREFDGQTSVDRFGQLTISFAY